MIIVKYNDAILNNFVFHLMNGLSHTGIQQYYYNIDLINKNITSISSVTFGLHI